MSEKERLIILKEKTIEELEGIEDKIDKIYIDYNIERGDIVDGEIGSKLKELKKDFTIKTSKIKKLNKQIRRQNHE